MLVFKLQDDLLDEALGVWNGWLALFGFVGVDSWLAVDPWMVLRALLTL